MQNFGLLITFILFLFRRFLQPIDERFQGSFQSGEEFWICGLLGIVVELLVVTIQVWPLTHIFLFPFCELSKTPHHIMTPHGGE